MPYLNKLQFLLVRSQPFKQAVDAITRKAEDRIHTPGDQAVKQDICNLLVHKNPSYSVSQYGDGNMFTSRNVGVKWAETAARDAVETHIEPNLATFS
jgi:hypothetical protein